MVSWYWHYISTGFHQVSDHATPKGILLMVSRPQELPLQSLAERYVNLSTHTAPIKQTQPSDGFVSF